MNKKIVQAITNKKYKLAEKLIKEEVKKRLFNAFITEEDPQNTAGNDVTSVDLPGAAPENDGDTIGAGEGQPEEFLEDESITKDGKVAPDEAGEESEEEFEVGVDPSVNYTEVVHTESEDEDDDDEAVTEDEDEDEDSDDDDDEVNEDEVDGVDYSEVVAADSGEEAQASADKIAEDDDEEDDDEEDDDEDKAMSENDDEDDEDLDENDDEDDEDEVSELYAVRFPEGYKVIRESGIPATKKLFKNVASAEKWIAKNK